MRSRTLSLARCFSSSPSRSPVYKSVDNSDIAAFRSILGNNGVTTDVETLQPMNTDWMKKFIGQSRLALFPTTTQQVSQVLKYCNQQRLAVVPQGGNTGLVGGSVPVFDEVLLSTKRMNKIVSFDPNSGALAAEAGCVLAELDSYLEKQGFCMPLDLGAKGSCQIGGNVSTNAGGLRYVRYGSLHGSVLGLETVLADGTVLDSMTPLRKDNTGYDLKQLFIGAEGTLGVVTKVSVLAPRRPTSVNVALFGVSSYQKVLETSQMARASMLEIVSAVEFFDRQSLELVMKYQGAQNPLETMHPFYVLVETSGSDASHDAMKLDRFVAQAFEQGAAMDGTLASSEKQIRELWGLRENINISLGAHGAVYKYDVSLPVAQMYELVEKTKARTQSMAKVVVGYGHIGDSNLHLNVVVDQFCPEAHSLIEPWLFEQVGEYGGSISAEHGIGQCKPQYLGFSKTPEMVSTMQKIKHLFDPNLILNPYKVLQMP